MKLSTHIARLAAGAAGTAVAVALLAAPAGATTQHFKDHETDDATGAVFTCSGGDITVTGGTVSNAIEGTFANGVFHITGTITINGITAQDAAGNAYTITGASWFGGKSVGTDPDTAQVILETDTENFVIHNANGGVYGKVQAIEHLSPNGNLVSFDFGSCEPPSD